MMTALNSLQSKDKCDSCGGGLFHSHVLVSLSVSTPTEKQE